PLRLRCGTEGATAWSITRRTAWPSRSIPSNWGQAFHSTSQERLFMDPRASRGDSLTVDRVRRHPGVGGPFPWLPGHLENSPVKDQPQRELPGCVRGRYLLRKPRRNGATHLVVTPA